MLQGRAAVAHLLDLGRLRGVVAEDQPRLGVPEDVRAFLGRVGVVDRRHHRPGAQRAEVGQGPIGRGEPEDRDAIARFDAQVDQAAGDLGADPAEARVVDLDDATVARELERDPLVTARDASRTISPNVFGLVPNGLEPI